MGGAMIPGGARCGAGHVPGGRSGRRRRLSLPADPAVRRFIVRQASRAERAVAGADVLPWAWLPGNGNEAPGAWAGGVTSTSGSADASLPAAVPLRRVPARSSALRREAGGSGAPDRDGALASAPGHEAGGSARAPRRRPVDGGGPGHRSRRPVRLTRRGRLVVLAFMLLLCGLTAAVAAAPGRAADPARPRATAVVRPGDTLWSFTARNAPGRDPYAAIEEVRRLNHIEGYVIHPGQRLVLPRRR
jgi:hypothetical protein